MENSSSSFDWLSGYTHGRKMNTINEEMVIKRCLFLETVAGVPGFVAAMVRHLHSLRHFHRQIKFIVFGIPLFWVTVAEPFYLIPMP